MACTHGGLLKKSTGYESLKGSVYESVKKRWRVRVSKKGGGYTLLKKEGIRAPKRKGTSLSKERVHVPKKEEGYEFLYKKKGTSS